MMHSLAASAVLATLAAAKSTNKNMNGEYAVASVDTMPVPFNSDYASKGHEYFDVWAPEIATKYAEVFWKDQGVQPLPQAIVDRFKGKVIAITGYEQDQVMVVPTGKPGLNPEQDVSVPINWAYNHHFMGFMNGAHSEMVEVDTHDNMYMDVSSHGAPTKMVPREMIIPGFPKLFKGVPSFHEFSEGNGGESRKSFHGYPEGFAQLLESPTTWHLTPMQIDTRNPDCGRTYKDIDNCTAFTPSIEPRSARYGRGWQGVATPALPSNYSALVECPCNSRFGGDPMFYPDSDTKIIKHTYAAIPSAVCPTTEVIADAAACFAAAVGVGVGAHTWTNKTVSDPAQPAGCSVTKDEKTGAAAIVFNSAKASTAGCPASKVHVGSVTSVISAAASTTLEIHLQEAGESTPMMQRQKKGQYCANNQKSLQVFAATSNNTKALAASLAACEAYCLSTEACAACSVDNKGEDHLDGVSFNALASCGLVHSWYGAMEGDLSVKKVDSAGVATLTLTGPADKWFGFGLHASAMSDAPYTLVVNDQGVTERQIGTCGSEAEHCPGDLLPASITLVSNSVSGGIRTAVVTRALAGASKLHYSFQPQSVSTVNFITAVGSSQAFGYHAGHVATVITWLADAGPTCLCQTATSGVLCHTNGTACGTGFVKGCVTAKNGGDLITQANPTCNSKTYSGGLKCCSHGNILLDSDQEVRLELLQYHMKFRFWFQEYVPANASKTPKTSSNSTASHFNLDRIYFQTEENAGEYDIPPSTATKEYPTIAGYNGYPVDTLTPGTTCEGTCPNGPDCECTHTITYNHTISSPMRLIYAGGHCHAPSCLGLWLYRNDPGHEMELLCHQQQIYGVGTPGDKWDEVGYVTLPPCLWGDDGGLNSSVLLPHGAELVAIKKNRNTNQGHYGEMASWQMRGVHF